MPIESFIKIQRCFSYKFAFIVRDKINHVGGVVIDIGVINIHLYFLLVVVLNIILTGMIFDTDIWYWQCFEPHLKA